MAIKAEISFKVFENGNRIYAVRKSTMVDSWQDVIDKATDYVRSEYPEIDQATIHFNEENELFGIGIIIATANNRLFKLEANKIQ